MKQRLITAAVGICIAVPFFIFSHTFAWEIFVAIISFLGVFELLRALKLMGKWEVSAVSLLFAAMCPLFCMGSTALIYDITVLYVCVALFLGFIAIRRVLPEKLCYAGFLTVYVVCAFTSLVALRRLPSGECLIWLVFVGAWSTDSFAYFVGRFFGRTKLCPILSPKKTVEGAIGGLLGCVVFCVIYGAIVDSVTDYKLNYLTMIVTGAILGLVSQFGDLLMSAFKRNVGIKDYSNILPGHGGILDRFDSIMAVSLFVLFVVERAPIFV